MLVEKGLHNGQEEPCTLLRVSIPSEHPIDIRMFGLILELRLGAGDAAVVWELAFKHDGAESIKDSERVINRLREVTGKMPEAWFAYRNFAYVQQQHTPGAPRVVNFADGSKWTFTGFLASAEYLGNREPETPAEALGESL